MSILNRINKGINLQREQYNIYQSNVNEHTIKYGNDNSDYLIHNRLMAAYYKGSYEALEALKKTITG